MSRNYIEQRIKEALKKHNGNATRARQQVIAWAAEDQQLLLALTKSHLTGIVAYNIERILSGRSARTENAATKAAQNVANPQKPSKEENFGKELLKAVAGNSGATFGLEGYSAPRKKTQVSKSHIDAIQAMARKVPPSEF